MRIKSHRLYLGAELIGGSNNLFVGINPFGFYLNFTKLTVNLIPFANLIPL
jgi:hypothetical protein